jgi:RimJ/RimL family protein N-acetyltransferase
VELNETRERMGMCGLIKRDTLTYVDLGFAFLRSFWRRGYAFEAATAVLSYGRQALCLRIVAIVSKDNHRSRTLLKRLGFRLESVMKRPNDEELDLYAVAA